MLHLLHIGRTCEKLPKRGGQFCVNPTPLYCLKSFTVVPAEAGTQRLCFSSFGTCLPFSTELQARVSPALIFLSLLSSQRRQGPSVFRFTAFTPLDSRLRGNDKILLTTIPSKSAPRHAIHDCILGSWRGRRRFYVQHAIPSCDHVHQTTRQFLANFSALILSPNTWRSDVV